MPAAPCCNFSSAAAALRRAVSSRYRLHSSRKMNIVTESKYTSPLPADGGMHAADEGGGDAKRDRHVHAEHAAPEAGPCTRKNGSAEYSTAGTVSIRLAQRISAVHVGIHRAVGGHVDRHRVHHHLHHRQAGDEQLAEQRLAGTLAIVRRGVTASKG